MLTTDSTSICNSSNNLLDEAHPTQKEPNACTDQAIRVKTQPDDTSRNSLRTSRRKLLDRCHSIDDIAHESQLVELMPCPMKQPSALHPADTTTEKSDTHRTRPNMLRRAMSVRTLKTQDMSSFMPDRACQSRKHVSSRLFSDVDEEDPQNEPNSGSDTSHSPPLDRRKAFRTALSVRKLVDTEAKRSRLSSKDLSTKEQTSLGSGQEKKLSRRDLLRQSLSGRKDSFDAGKHEPLAGKQPCGDKIDTTKRQLLQTRSSVEDGPTGSRMKMLTRSLSVRGLGTRNTSSQRSLLKNSFDITEETYEQLTKASLESDTTLRREQSSKSVYCDESKERSGGNKQMPRSVDNKASQRRLLSNSKSSIDDCSAQSRRKMLGRSLSVRNIGMRDSNSQRMLISQPGSAADLNKMSKRKLLSKSASDDEIKENRRPQLLCHSKSSIEDTTVSRSRMMGKRSFSVRNLKDSLSERKKPVGAVKKVPPPRGPGLQRIESIRRKKGDCFVQSNEDIMNLRAKLLALAMIFAKQCLQGLISLWSVIRHNKTSRLVWTTLLDLVLFTIGRSFTIVLWCLAAVLTAIRVVSEWIINQRCVQQAVVSLYTPNRGREQRGAE